MLELLASLLILILAVALVRRLLGIERGRWGVTLLAVLVGEACAVLVLRLAVGNLRDLAPRAAFLAYALVTVFAMFGIVVVELLGRVSLLSEAEDVRVARVMVNKIVTGMVGSALALSSAILLTVQSPPGPKGLSLLSLPGGTGLFFSVLLLLRLVVQILRERD